MRSLAPPVLASVIWVEDPSGEEGIQNGRKTLSAGPIEGELNEGKQIVGLCIPEEQLLLRLRLLRAAEFGLRRPPPPSFLFLFFLQFLIYFTPFSQFFLFLFFLVCYFFQRRMCFILPSSSFFFFFFILNFFSLFFLLFSFFSFYFPFYFPFFHIFFIWFFFFFVLSPWGMWSSSQWISFFLARYIIIFLF